VFQADDFDNYLQIKVEGISLAGTSSLIELSENLEEHSLTNDEQTVDEYIPTTNSKTNTDGNPSVENPTPIKFRGLIDIILHPIYRVPCPYVRLFDANGQPTSEDAIQMLTSSQRNTSHSRGSLDKPHNSSSSASDKVPSPNPFEDGISHLEVNAGDCKFTYEEHPYLHTPCLCLHVCGVGDRLGLIDSMATQAPLTMGPKFLDGITSESGSNHHGMEEVDGSGSKGEVSNADLYFLNWFMLVARKIGFQVTASFYQNASDSLR
jgi:Autophagocytosis associated protein, active-site domain